MTCHGFNCKFKSVHISEKVWLIEGKRTYQYNMKSFSFGDPGAQVFSGTIPTGQWEHGQCVCVLFRHWEYFE